MSVLIALAMPGRQETMANNVFYVWLALIRSRRVMLLVLIVSLANTTQRSVRFQMNALHVQQDPMHLLAVQREQIALVILVRRVSMERHVQSVLWANLANWVLQSIIAWLFRTCGCVDIYCRWPRYDFSAQALPATPRKFQY